MSPQDVKVVSLELGDQEAAYKARRVDAVVIFGPARSNLLKEGAIPFSDSSLTTGEIVDTLAASTHAIADNPEILQALVAARFKTLDFFESNPADATLRMAGRTQVKPEEMLAAFCLFQQPSLEENVALLSQRDPSLLVSMTKLVRVMEENGLISKQTDPASLRDSQFVEHVWAGR
jgi:NitT/TauT family transport system substrate-binding protein